VTDLARQAGRRPRDHLVLHALSLLGLDHYMTGEWQELQSLADEHIRLCETHNYRLLECIGWYLQAMLPAARGNDAAMSRPWCTSRHSRRTRASRQLAHRRFPGRRDGFLFLDRDKFHASFAGDLPAGQAAFMADSQVPWGVNALGGTITEAAWRIKPSWYLIATDDRMISPPAQRAMSERTGSTVTEVPGSHSIYVSQPAAVAALITQAATATRG
jgi:Alpha/beta hydrolase family